MPNDTLSQLLLQSQLINADQLQDALDKQLCAKKPLHELLIEMGFLSDEALQSALSSHLNSSPQMILEHEVDPQAIQKLPFPKMIQYAAFPFQLKDGTLKIAMSNPLDEQAIAAMQKLVNVPLQIVFVTRQTITHWTDRLDINDDVINRLVNFSSLKVNIQLSCLVPHNLPLEYICLNQEDSPTVKLINLLITDALGHGASDIRMESLDNDLVISYLTKNQWDTIVTINNRHQQKILSRLKLIASMDLNKKDKMLTGYAQVNSGGKEIYLRITVETTLKETRIIISLSDVDSGHKQAHAPTPVDIPSAPVATAQGALRILTIDDSDIILRLIGGFLTSGGYEVIKALNGQEGVERAIEHRPDLIITDIDMPIMNGFEAVIALRKNIETSQIPIIILTTRSDSTSEIIGLDSGADDFLVKPVTKEKLLARVKLLLKRSMGRK